MIDIEDQLRSAFDLRAQATTLTHPPMDDAHTTVPRRRRTVLLVTSLGAIIATVVGLVVLTTRSVDPKGASIVASPTTVTTPATVPASAPTSTSVPLAPVVGRGWRALPSAPLSDRDDPAVAWTGDQLLVWGGGTINSAPADDGAAYDPVSDSWTILPAGPLAARHDPVSAWTGTEMIAWGGTDATGVPLGDGAAYNPTTDLWRTVATAPLDGATATFASTVWTGSELIIWGGDNADGQPRSAGAAYNPTTDSWRTLAGSPLQARHEAATVWTGTEMVLWGGSPSPGPGFAPFSDGAAYNPTSDTWRLIAASPLAGRIAPAVWTGSEMIVAAGRTKDGDGPFAFADGAAYDPARDSWRKIADGPAHPGFKAAWSGTALLASAKGHLFSYDLAANTWTAVGDAGFFPGEGRALWTGHELLLVGTSFRDTVPIGIVAAYTP